MRAALYCYFGKIMDNNAGATPDQGPLMFLPNHQNALLDALLIATLCRRKPYFLTRSDVFSNALFRSLFYFFRMLPVYRLRDGRRTLGKNEEIFQRCADLLSEGEAILIFPEANHNLERRVRPLSKGFTRILFRCLEQNPGLEIQLMPVGLNYNRAADFPDTAALFYGTPISVERFYLPENTRVSVDNLKYEVSEQLKTLTTHIPEAFPHDQAVTWLRQQGIDFMDPVKANQELLSFPDVHSTDTTAKHRPKAIMKGVFYLLNFPLSLIWFWIKNRIVPEPEFTSTFRFGFALLGFPIFYLLSLVLMGPVIGYAQTLTLVALHFGLNQLYIKSLG